MWVDVCRKSAQFIQHVEYDRNQILRCIAPLSLSPLSLFFDTFGLIVFKGNLKREKLNVVCVSCEFLLLLFTCCLMLFVMLVAPMYSPLSPLIIDGI